MIASDRDSARFSGSGLLLAALLAMTGIPSLSLAQSLPEFTGGPGMSPVIDTLIEARGRFAAATTTLPAAQHLLRLKAMHLVAVSEERDADAEALLAGIKALESASDNKLSATDNTGHPGAALPWSGDDSSYTQPRGGGMPGDSTSASDRRSIATTENAQDYFQLLLTLREYQSVALRLSVQGASSGTVWGTEYYSDDSLIPVAALHAGLIQPNEIGEVVLVSEPGQTHYNATERNGVQSRSWGAYGGSYRLLSIKDKPDAAYFSTRAGLFNDNAPDAQSFLTIYMLDGQIPKVPGTTFIAPLVGRANGQVWGSGPYTADSSLDAAALHSGLLAPGEKRLVKVTLLEGRASYSGTTSNGVQSQPYGKWDMSFKLEAVPKTTSSQLSVRL